MVAVERCAVHRSHVPSHHNVAHHHILPKSWGGQDVETNVVVICPTGHENVHTLLNEYVRHDGAPPWSIRMTFSVVERRLAEMAWEQRPTTNPPYTTARGEA